MNRVKILVAVVAMCIGMQAQQAEETQDKSQGAQAQTETKSTAGTMKQVESKPLPESPRPQNNDDLKDDTKILGLGFAAETGSGWDAHHDPTAQAGIKFVGGPLTLDLGFDRSGNHNGFSTEGSVLIPLFRLPTRSALLDSNFLRVYAEPGVGHRWGGKEASGGYSSAKIMMVLFSNRRLDLDHWSPFIEVQRRFPFSDPMRGDNRISFGLIAALCNTCGID